MNYIKDLYEKVIKEAKQLDIPISNKLKEDVIINNRAKSRFGCCKKIKKGSKEIYEIELSYRLMNCEEKVIKQTLAHEILHTCPGCDNHGNTWKSYAKKMNDVYGYNIKRTDTSENLGIKNESLIKESLKANYILVCKKCGTKFSRTRMSNLVKHPSNYRCKCGGALERVK